MAKELPYFRFTAFEWLNDDISLESYELKGLFADICAYYWFKDCSITIAMLEKRFNGAKDMIHELIDLVIIKVKEDNEFLEITFLDKQYDILSEQRKRRQNAGSKGGKQKSSNAKAKLKQSSSYKDKDKYKEKDNNKDNKEEEILLFFHNTCIDLPKVLKLTEQRKKSIEARIEEYDHKTLGKVFKMTNESDFLSGRTDKFKASFDWILKKANFIKILEGNYKNKVGLTQYKVCSWQDLSDMSVKNKDIFNEYKKIKIPSGFGYVRKDDFKRYNLVEYKKNIKV